MSIKFNILNIYTRKNKLYSCVAQQIYKLKASCVKKNIYNNQGRILKADQIHRGSDCEKTFTLIGVNPNLV